MPYEVKLRSGRKPGWSCTCPVGEDGSFCKHCVAVALEVAEPEPAAKRPARRRSAKEPDLRHYVAGLDVDVLVELVMEQAESDWRLRERLQASAVAAGGGSLDVRGWKRRIDAVFGGGDFVLSTPYRSTSGRRRRTSRRRRTAATGPRSISSPASGP